MSTAHLAGRLCMRVCEHHAIVNTSTGPRKIDFNLEHTLEAMNKNGLVVFPLTVWWWQVQNNTGHQPGTILTSARFVPNLDG